MSIPTFTEGYPPDGSSLGQTKSTIRDNLDGTFLTLGVDHIDNNGQPGSNPAGYHNLIHVVPQSGDPTPIAGIDQWYSKIVNFGGIGNQTQQFHMNGGGGVSQLSGTYLQPNGYQFIGAVILAWGIVNSTASSGSVNFPIIYNNPTPGFSNNIYNVQCTPIVSSSSNHASTVYVQGATLTGFTWYQADRASDQIGFYWLAIGN